MAEFSAIFPFGTQNGVTATLNATTASSAISVGTNTLVAFNATDDVTITIGTATVAPTTPSATVGFRIPANTTTILSFDRNHSKFQIYNGTAGVVTYSYQILSRL